MGSTVGTGTHGKQRLTSDYKQKTLCSVSEGSISVSEGSISLICPCHAAALPPSLLLAPGGAATACPEIFGASPSPLDTFTSEP